MAPVGDGSGPSTSQGVGASSFSCAEAVRWYCDNPKQLLLNWSQHVGQLGAKNPDVARVRIWIFPSKHLSGNSCSWHSYENEKNYL